MTTAEAPSVILSRDELQQLTGYKRASEQHAELMRQGFYRARRSPVDGTVILERPHFDAVSSGAGKPANEPTVRPPKVRSR